jgi:hypothetical protein
VASTGKSIGGGFLLFIMGIIIVYQTIIFHYREIFPILGVGIIFFGLYLILNGYLRKSNLEIPNINKNKDSKSNILKVPKNNNVPKLTAPNNDKKVNNLPKFKNNVPKIKNLNTNKLKNKVKSVNKSKKPNEVLHPTTSKTFTDKKLNFVPNYSKPKLITRKPKKRSFVKNSSLHVNHEKPANDSFNPSQVSKQLNEDDMSVNTSITNISPKNNLNNDSEDMYSIGSASKDNEIKSKLSAEEDSRNISSNFLKSYVICENNILTSQQAFESLANHAKKKILIEASSLKEMSEKFFASLSSLDVRMIIQDFDIKDMTYALLISSLIEQGVQIRTMPSVNTVNLVSDDNYALIISENDIDEEFEVGAVYTDRKAIIEVKEVFDKSWEIAKELDINFS